MNSQFKLYSQVDPKVSQFNIIQNIKLSEYNNWIGKSNCLQSSVWTVRLPFPIKLIKQDEIHQFLTYHELKSNVIVLLHTIILHSMIKHISRSTCSICSSNKLINIHIKRLVWELMSKLPNLCWCAWHNIKKQNTYKRKKLLSWFQRFVNSASFAYN